MLAVYFCEENPSRKQSYINTIKALIEAGTKVNEKAIDAVDGLKRSAIHWAAISGYRSAILTVRSYGPDLNMKDHWDCTPLHYAMSNALQFGDTFDTDIALLETVKIGEIEHKGTDPNIQDRSTIGDGYFLNCAKF